MFDSVIHFVYFLYNFNFPKLFDKNNFEKNIKVSKWWLYKTDPTGRKLSEFMVYYNEHNVKCDACVSTINVRK